MATMSMMFDFTSALAVWLEGKSSLKLARNGQVQYNDPCRSCWRSATHWAGCSTPSAPQRSD